MLVTSPVILGHISCFMQIGSYYVIIIFVLSVPKHSDFSLMTDLCFAVLKFYGGRSVKRAIFALKRD